MVTRLVVFFVILGVCSGNSFNRTLDELNSHENFADRVQEFLDWKGNGISLRCNYHMSAYIKGLKSKKMWALQMFDASAKFPSGLMKGNIVDLGFFDECLEVKNKTFLKRITGKYCIGTIPLANSVNQKQYLSNGLNSDILQPTARIVTPDQTIGLQFGICIPQSCDTNDLEKVFTGIGLNMKFYDEFCQTKSDQPQLDSGAIATISFLGVILWIMLFCTAYDAIIYYLEKPPFHPLLTAFSILSNGKRLLKTSNSSNQISCLHGIRVISTMWVILGHRYVFQVSLPVRNLAYVFEWMDNKAHLFIINALLSVDTFFLLSGLVVAYIYMSTVSKGIKFNIILFYIHRYVRLTPVLAVIILVHVTLFKYFGSGPIYPSTTNIQLVDGCEKYWWKTLLYIQNYGDQQSLCIPQSWYLSVDTQLFLLSPIILLPLKRWPKPTLWFTGILTFLSMLASFLTGWFMELNTNIAGNQGSALFDYMKWYYMATQTRAGPWLIGIMLGYFIFQVKQRIVRTTINIWLVLALWGVSLAVLCTCLFTGHELIFGDYNRLGNSIHMALVRPAWSVAIGWVIYACVIGYGGPVNWFLSLSIFQILSKFTYTLYLLHLQVIIMTTATMRTLPTFSNGNEMYIFWGDFALTLAAAILFTLAFESPMITIEQTLFGKTKKKDIKPAQPEEPNYIPKTIEIA